MAGSPRCRTGRVPRPECAPEQAPRPFNAIRASPSFLYFTPYSGQPPFSDVIVSLLTTLKVRPWQHPFSILERVRTMSSSTSHDPTSRSLQGYRARRSSGLACAARVSLNERAVRSGVLPITLSYVSALPSVLIESIIDSAYNLFKILVFGRHHLASVHLCR